MLNFGGFPSSGTNGTDHGYTAASQNGDPGTERNKVPDLKKNKKERVEPDRRQPGVPELELQWCTGLLVRAAQMMVAAVAGIVYKHRLTMIVTFGGIFLRLAGGTLPHLRNEKMVMPRAK